MKTIEQMQLENKRVLLRTEFSVPVEEDGTIKDDSRIRESIPTIRYILSKNPKQLIIMSKIGDPEGKVVENLKMNRVAERLTQLLGKKVAKTDDCILQKLPEEKIILLENLRFHKEEGENDIAFAQKLASYGDVYVNDAFGVCHRKNASMHAITQFLPGAIGLLVKKELEYLNIEKMPKPIYSILGGAKLKTKIPLIERMLSKADKVIVGGGMIFTFYAERGMNIGGSLLEKDYLARAKEMSSNPKLYLPKDVVVADAVNKETNVKNVPIDAIPPQSMGLDVGEKSIEEMKALLKNAKTIIWNGPLGYYEKPPFDHATNEMATYIASLNCTKIAGGGDTADAIHQLGLENKFTFISTGGGASLEVLSGNKLAALQALEENSAHRNEDI